MTVLFTLPLMATHSAQPLSPAHKRPDLLLSSQNKFIVSKCGLESNLEQAELDRQAPGSYGTYRHGESWSRDHGATDQGSNVRDKATPLSGRGATQEEQGRRATSFP
ncbi:hypothetical protein LY76DRAFT_310907 [Colletotrichum caudatum]|nr:hypothetical protein LY76DRAFT_310907 [Colletotrichum caudatum]